MRISVANTVGVIVDVQARLLPVMHEPDRTIAQITRLIHGLRLVGLPLLATEQYPKGLGATVPEVVAAWSAPVSPGVDAAVTTAWEPIQKMTFSCMDETAFRNALDNALPVDSDERVVLIAGIESHVCVLQTTVDLLDAGYEPVVVWDAVSSRNPTDRDIARERVIAEGARVTSVESILFELTRESGTPLFKEISRLVK